MTVLSLRRPILMARGAYTPLLAACAALVALFGVSSGAAHAASQPLVWQLVTNQGPSPRLDPFISYDSVSNRAILFGGAYSAAPMNASNETWEWDGAIWKQLFPQGTIPAPRHGAGQLGFDPVRNLTVLFGGYGQGSLLGYHEIFSFNGTSWTLNTTPGPFLGNGASVAYDEARGVMLFFGATDWQTGTRDTWTWDGSTFRKVANENQGPSPRIYAGLAYHPLTRKVYLFGGRYEFEDPNDPTQTYTEWYDDTWEWDGTRWTRLYPAGPIPSKRNPGGMTVWHGGWQKIVIHGGAGVGLFGLNDTWTRDGTRWEEVPTQNTPSGRYGICWYDETRNSLMLYGGMGGWPPRVWGETWELAEGWRTPTPTLPPQSPSPSITPTPTITPTPSNTPTPTPIPGGKMGVRISGRYDQPNRTLFIDMGYYNRNTDVDPIPVDLWVVVEILGNYYFYPTFSETPTVAAQFSLVEDFDSGTYELTRIRLDNPLPMDIATTWYAALFHSVTGDLIGNVVSTRVVLVAP